MKFYAGSSTEFQTKVQIIYDWLRLFIPTENSKNLRLAIDLNSDQKFKNTMINSSSEKFVKKGRFSRLFFLKICYNIQNILLILHGENMAVKKKKIVISKLNRNNNHKHSEKRKHNK